MNPHVTPESIKANEAEEMAKLVRLRDALVARGVRAELCEHGNVVLVYRPPSSPGMPVWVFIGYGGAYYSWQSAEKRHPVDDVEGAAEVLAAYVRR